MTVVRVTSTGPIELTPEPFQLERELEDLVVASPNLVATPGDPRIALVRRQVGLPGGGSLDVLLVDSAGTPIVVEAKLGRNGQSRREVVGQVVDYVSLLTSMTVDELDQAVSGALETSIRSLLTTPDDVQRFDELWRAVGTNLRAGAARYVIVLDEAPPELERIVRFLASRSNLDMSLVTLTKYRDNEGHCIVVPQLMVRSTTMDETVGGPNKSISAELQAVVDAYNTIAPAGLVARGRSPGYRQIRPPGWPGGLHYEFLKYSEEIGIEIHIEADAGLVAAPKIKSFAGPPRQELAHTLEWDQRWTRNRGRLTTRVSASEPASVAAQAMMSLINLTLKDISTALGASSSAGSA